MLLNELIDVKKSQVNINRPFNSTSNLAFDDTVDSGTFSAVIPDENDPHMVKKYNLRPHKELEYYDPFWQYVNYIVDNKLSGSNPYFPRIYSVKNYIGSNKNEFRKTHMEKLEPFNHEEFHKIIDNLMIKQHGQDINTVLDAIFYNKWNTIKDEQLIEACKHLNICKLRIKAHFDLGEHNVMFRRGPYGIQLVFIDPYTR